MNKSISVFIIFLSILFNTVRGETFNPTPITFTPANTVEFKLNLPVTHLDVNNYVPSSRAVYAGQTIAFRLYLRQLDWVPSNVFMNVRWDTDFDASNGITWSDWETNQNQGYSVTRTRVFQSPGKYTLTFEFKLFNSIGQSYVRQKQYDLYVVPMPTSVYQDQSNNKLFYWAGTDNMYDRPAFLVEGYDPLNDTPPELNYAMGFDLAELVRNSGYDIFIMEWADGGADLSNNKDVFLSACRFMHDKLGSTEAAVQVVGISMGGVIGRYALSWAEDAGELNHNGQYIEHYVNTFVSFDSPQQGAQLNENFQGVIQDYGSAGQQSALLATAAKQMLYSDVFDGSNHTHDLFYNSLRLLNDNSSRGGEYTNGYPRRCKNYAVSNGNRSANYPDKSTADLLGKIDIHVNVNVANIITLPAVQHTFNINAEQRDLWPGSTFTGDLTKLYAEGYRGFFDMNFGPFAFQAGGAWRFQILFNPTYTPTESALDLDAYTRTNDGSIIGGTSWFNETLTQTTFRRHEELTVESKNKVKEWLDNNRTYPYLGKPSGVTAAALSYKQIKINFVDQASFEEGFKIERKAANGQFTEIATIGPNVNQFIDYCTEPNTSYTYRLRSFSGSRASIFSDGITVTTPAVGAIQAPANLVAAGEPTYVNLAWNAVSGATGYRIYRSVNGCPNMSIQVSGNSYQDFVPTSQESYSYQVTALNNNAEGPVSNIVSSRSLHLASTSANSLSSNTQTKIIKTTDNKLQMVYESGGAVFLTSSSNNGDVWNNETLLSPLPTTTISYRNPTLLFKNNGDTYSTIYERVERGSSSFKHTILWNGGPPVYQSHQWPFEFCGTINSLDNFYTTSDFQSNPVAVMTKANTAAPSIFAVAYARGGEYPGLSLLIGPQSYPDVMSCVGSTGLQAFWLDNVVPMMNPQNPAIAVRTKTSQSKETNIPRYWFFVVWEEPGANGGIKFTYGTLEDADQLSAANIVWHNPSYTIAANSNFWTCTRPSIALDASNNITIAYEYQHLLAHKGYIRTQKRISADVYAAALEEHTFSSTCYGEGFFPHSPSVTDYRFSPAKPNDLTLVWHTNDGKILSAQYSANSWSDPYLVATDGKQASVLTTYNVNDNQRSILYSGAAGPAYAINSKILSGPVAPSKPVLLAPNNMAVGVTIPLTLSWNCVPGASGYTIQIDNEADFNSPVYTWTGLTYTSIQVSSLSPVTTYYWRVKAASSNGTSGWSNEPNWWRFTTGQSVAGGCPFLFVWNGNKFVEDNNILPQSEYSDSIRGDVTDYYKLRRRVGVTDNEYVLQIREYERERSRFDQFRLLVVDHPAGTNIAVDQTGELALYTTPLRMTRAVMKGSDVIRQLSLNDSDMVSGQVGDVLSLQFQRPSGKLTQTVSQAGGAMIAGVEPPLEEKKRSIGKIAVGSDASKGGIFAFRRRPSVVYVPFGSIDTTEITLQLDQRCYLDYVNIGVQLPDRFQVQEAPLRSAQHSVRGNVKSKVIQSDNMYASLEPGETIELHFLKVQPAFAGERSYVLISEGRYVRIYDPPKPALKQIPEQFGLEQNYPNPFNPSTSFRYQLPLTAFVTIEVYNLLGQLIESLVNVEQPAGEYTETWNARNASSGIYYVHLTATDRFGKQLFQDSKKVVLIK